LIGEPGVGKTAIAEGLATDSFRKCTDTLEDKRLVTLDMASVVAGTKYRGDLKTSEKIVEEIKTAGNIVLFVDDSTRLSARAPEGAVDAPVF